MAMAFTDILSELKTLDKFVAAQQKAGRNTEELIKSQLLSMKSKIKGIKDLDTDGALALSDAIDAMVNVWVPLQQSELNDVITNTLLQRCGPKKGGKRTSEILQTCKLENYLSDATIESMQDSTASRDTCISLVSHSAKMVGLVHPSESTYGRMTAIVVVIGLNDNHMPISALHSLCEDMKRTHKSSCANFSYPHEFIKCYPEHPRELSESMLSYANADGTLYTPHSFGPMIDHVCSQTFLRKSGTEVAKARRGSSANLLPSSSSSQAMVRHVPVLDLSEPNTGGNNMQNMMQMMMQNMCQMMMQNTGGNNMQSVAQEPLDKSMSRFRERGTTGENEWQKQQRVEKETKDKEEQIERDAETKAIADKSALGAESPENVDTEDDEDKSAADPLAELRRMQEGMERDSQAAQLAKVAYLDRYQKGFQHI